MRYLLFICIVLLYSCNTFKKTSKVANRNSTISLDYITIKPKNNKFLTFQKTPDKIIDILHTDLKVKFDFKNHQLNGIETCTITPYIGNIFSFYLDAKMMTFNTIKLIDEGSGKELDISTTYDSVKLFINTIQPLVFSKKYSLVINYKASPDEVEKGNGSAIKDDKGLYFINTDYKEPYKPMQIWTQGETESNSCWFPTTDKPFEKCTFKLSIEVPDSLQTLSNGTLTYSTKQVYPNNKDTFRNDVWVQSQPMSPYLVMMAIGNFAQVKESWNGKLVDYYVDTLYKKDAAAMFNNTVEMIDFYSTILGVQYPWDKYSQVIAHDYVSGAMENTSATLHGLPVQKNERELIDYKNDGIIAHELFHQWFGDLVTCENWAHLTLNEGFASFGEQLWYEYKYGKDEGLRAAYNSMQSYLNYARRVHDNPIINFQYEKPDDMFSSITYKKGARVLNLLRFEIGDSLFYLSLKNYLTSFSYKSAQIDDLKRIVENTTGKDMRPFFEQWFMQGGHPTLKIIHTKNDTTKEDKITILQTQDSDLGIFHFPIQIKINEGDKEEVKTYTIQKKKTVITYSASVQDENFQKVFTIDPNGLFIGTIEENNSINDLLQKQKVASTYIDKVRNINELALLQEANDTSKEYLINYLKDNNNQVQQYVIQKINWTKPSIRINNKLTLINIVNNNENTLLKADAIEVLDSLKDTELLTWFMQLSQHASYSVAAAAINATATILPSEAIRICNQLDKDVKGDLLIAISTLYASHGDSSHEYFFNNNFLKVFNSQRASLITKYGKFVLRLNKKSISDQFINNAHKILEIDKSELVQFKTYLALLNLSKNTTQKETNELLFNDTKNRIIKQNNKNIVKWLKEYDYNFDEIKK
jgi:aminopeptidase N